MQRTAPDVSARVSINDRVAALLSGDLATSAVSILTAVFYGALLFRYDRTLALVGVIVALLNLVALRYVSRKRLESNEKLGQDRGRLMGTSMNGLLSIETLKATGSESDFFARWSGLLTRMMVAEQKLSLSTLRLGVVPSSAESAHVVPAPALDEPTGQTSSAFSAPTRCGR